MHKKSKLTTLVVALFSLTTAQAVAEEKINFSEEPRLVTLAEAYTLHQDAKYTQSYQQFNELRRLGNGRASAQLGLMTLGDEGTTYDPVRAWAYFQQGGELGFDDGYALAEEVYEQLSVDQRQRSTDVLQTLHADLLITQHQKSTFRHHEITHIAPEPVQRRTPRYPDNSLHRGEIGYTAALLLIGTDGRVAAAESLFSNNRNFERESLRTVASWRYEPSAAPRTVRVLLDYYIQGHGSNDPRQPYLRVINDVTWAKSMAGVPGYQSAQGAYLLAITQKGESPNVQPRTLSEAPPTLDDFLRTEQEEGDEPNWPQNWTSGYWFRQAAQSGDKVSQRFLAHNHDEWADYLISQGDARVAAWSVALWLQQDELPELREKGMRYLQYLRDTDHSADSVTRDIVNTLSAHYVSDAS